MLTTLRRLKLDYDIKVEPAYFELIDEMHGGECEHKTNHFGINNESDESRNSDDSPDRRNQLITAEELDSDTITLSARSNSVWE